MDKHLEAIQSAVSEYYIHMLSPDELRAYIAGIEFARMAIDNIDREEKHENLLEMSFIIADKRLYSMAQRAREAQYEAMENQKLVSSIKSNL